MNFKIKLWVVINAVLITLFVTGCETINERSVEPPPVAKIEATPQAIEDAYTIMARSERDTAASWADKTFEEFEAGVYREPDTGIYIVNGDTPIIDSKHLREFFENKVQKAGIPQAGLSVMVVGGVDATWAEHEKRGLTYCVSTTFGARHGAVISEMAAATDAWEAVADINFEYVAAQDSSCNATNNQVVFDVRPASSGNYLARAFFPGDPRSQRNVLIDNSSFSLDPTGNLTLEGILRHELGHTLGFRHEHTRPDAGTCFEDDNWRELTSYDAFSVMHYPQCNGAGDWSLQLTAMDQSGAACLYGPAPGFSIDTSICTVSTPPPSPCGEQTVTESGSVGQGNEVQFGPYSTQPGSNFKVVMNGQGDPDLYVRFLLPPDQSTFSCRPFLSGASETCDLTVPANSIRAFVMVRGYSAGDFNLHITHTPNP